MSCDCRELCRRHGIPEEHSGRVHNLRRELLAEQCALLAVRVANNCGTNFATVAADLRARGQHWNDCTTLAEIESGRELLLD
jgi:hypothetical protein